MLAELDAKTQEVTKTAQQLADADAAVAAAQVCLTRRVLLASLLAMKSHTQALTAGGP